MLVNPGALPREGRARGGATVPFNRVSVVGRELDYLRRVAEGGALSGGGELMRRCEELLSTELGGARVLLTPSGTAALEMCALLLEVGPGDEVIVPSFTFPTTASAFVLRGARPVFADIRSDTLDLDERLLEPLIGPRTRAIVPVHYGGIACALDEILELADRAGLAVVEDNAHGLFASFAGRALGTFGALSIASFHGAKNFTCGEGGALVVNDPRLIERAEVLREMGTDRARFLRGETSRYTWVDLGSSWLPSELTAAFLLGQLEEHAAVQARRRAIWEAYRDGLSEWAAGHGVALPNEPAGCVSSYHLFHLLLPSPAERDALLRHLAGRGIEATRHFEPLHLAPIAARFGPQTPCPVAEAVARRIVRLPLFFALTAEEQDRVIDAVIEFRPQ